MSLSDADLVLQGDDPGAARICWHEPYSKCRKSHDGHLHVTYGRCRSGRRWFWAALGYRAGVGVPFAEHGWAETEAASQAEARAAVVRLAAGSPALAFYSPGTASQVLKDINAEKRRARPPSRAKDSRAAEYLYGSWYDSREDKHHLKRFRIQKRTAKRVYYLRREEDIDAHGEPNDDGRFQNLTFAEDEVGFVSRQELEAEGRVRNAGRHWSHSDSTLYVSLAVMRAHHNRHRETEEGEQLDLAALKAAMAAAHPDRGGTAAAFIEARRLYVQARRSQREVQR